MTAGELWTQFSKYNNTNGKTFTSWQFGSVPDELAHLVLLGIKTATASAFELYKAENEALPKCGDISIILDSSDNAVCIIETTNVYVVPFKDVSAEHAYKEGEDDRSLAEWRKCHEKFFRSELATIGKTFSFEMPVVCEEFKVIFKPETI